jgi:signal transduction histidine kinase
MPLVNRTPTTNQALELRPPLGVDATLDGVDAAVMPELLALHDRAGHYLSLQGAALVGLDLASLNGEAMAEAFVRPVNQADYLERLTRVVITQEPERFEAEWQWVEQETLQVRRMALVMSPLEAPTGATIGVVTTGQSITPLRPEAMEAAMEVAPVSPLNLQPRQLNQLAWMIRQTLDLPTIWQQAATGLGQSLGACRCVIYALDRGLVKANVVAEYRASDGIDSLLHQECLIETDESLNQALMRFRPTDLEAPTCPVTPMSPCVVSQEINPQTQQAITRLIIATGYQEKPNGLIVLYQCDRPRQWQPTEVAFVRELADQVGTAIAHARSFQELQKANTNLVRKQEDVEEARRQAEEASRLKSEFLANTSHELRTPLNGIMGFLKLVIDEMVDDPEEEKELLTETFRLSEHLLEVLNDVLNLAKIEAGKMQIECSSVNLNELLEEVDRQQGPLAKQKSLNFEVQPPPTLDEVVVFGNFQRLKQVLINLVGNAIKFTDEGGVTISTEIIRKRVLVNHQEFPGYAMVKVADTGIGVSLEKQVRLFQSFSQIDGSLTRRYGGTGLGLVISQRMVQEMGGEINFYSLGEGLGSTLTFTVPLFQEPVIAAG